MRIAFLLVALTILIAGCASNTCISVDGECTYNDARYFPHCEGNNIVTYECEDGCLAASVPCSGATACKAANASGMARATCE
jgi:hypothetical protein